MVLSRRYVAVCVLALLLSRLGGCTEDPAPEDEPGETALAVVVAGAGETDVAAFQVMINRVSCAGEPVDPWSEVIVREVNDLALNDAYVAAGSAHTFSDAFLVVEAGCYDVLAQPLQADGQPSEQCAPAPYDNAMVVDGQTTEIVLVSQCGPTVPAGALDAVAVLNQPPFLVEGLYFPDKSICHDFVQTFCATFGDPNGDPLQIVWEQIGGLPLEQGITSLGAVKNPDCSTTECVTWKHAGPGEVKISATAYDLFRDPNGPGLITFESHFAANGPVLPSGLPPELHDTQTFLAYGIYELPACPCDPHPEVVDTIDNDCNGVVDDFPEICGNGIDDDGDGQIDVGTPEVCDGEDDDCDGQIDEEGVCP